MINLKKNELYECQIEGYTAEGAGVARVEGAAVFVPATALGDKVLVRIVKVNKTYAFGRVEEIITPSAHRIAPECPVFNKCGGCDFLHIDYDEELRLKGQRVQDALNRIGHFDIEIAPAVPSIRHGYRNKALYLVTDTSEGTGYGFYRSRSHDVVPCGGCLIQTDAANALAAAVCRWIDESRATIYDENNGEGLIRRVYVRHGDGGYHLCIVANGEALPQTDLLIELARAAEPSLCGITLNVNKTQGNRVMGERMVTLWGSGTLSDSLMGLRYELSPLSFYQVNHAQAERLYQKVLDYAELSQDDIALDLYCGVGTITLLLAQRCKSAIGNEIVPEAVTNAEENMRRNNIENVRFILGDAGQVAATLAGEGMRPNVVVCDPPRKGMDETTINAIGEMSPKRIVYVSCDPASLARDGAMLRELGYILTHAEAFDMFPGTANVETVARFVK